MTTLPQTAPIRLPRTVTGVQPPAQLGPIPTLAHPMFPAGHHAGGQQMGFGDVLRVIRGHIWLIIFTLALFAAIGYAVNRYVLQPYYSKYTSTALLRVSTANEGMSRRVNPLQPGDPIDTAIRNEAVTQANMLKHDSLLIDVLGDVNSKVRQTTWWQEFGGNVEEAKEDLEDNFSAVPVPESRLIAVSMEYRVPDDCKVIVQEIIAEHLKKEQGKKRDDVLKQITPAKDMVRDLEFNLESIRRRIKEKAANLSADATSGNSVKQIELTRLYEERMRISRDLSEAKNKLANLHALNEQGNDPPGMDEMLSKNQHYISLRQQVDKLDAELGTSDLAPGHFKYTRMMQMRNNYASKLDDAREEAKQSLFASLAAEANADIDSAGKMLEDVKTQIASVSQEVSRSVSDRADLAALEAEEEGLTGRWEKASEELSKLNAVAGTVDFANVEWARYPQTPDMPSFPKLSITMSVALLVGLALSLGIAFFRELTDNTVRTPQDLARVGNMNLLGMIPHEDDDPQAAGSRLPLVIFDAPQSMMAESFRQVRSRLQHAASLETTRSMLVTSAGPGDGKTTVAVNLAAGLALNGRRILLVDANFRRPQMHNVFDTTNEYGFSDVLNSLEAFEQCVQATAVPNLSVLTSGAKPLNPTELLESQLLIDFIERALEEYDHVIFDTGPLPLVSETIALAPRVDGCITVVRARANSRGLLQRVRDTLRQVKAEHVGVVLNAVRAQAGGYYGRSIVDYYKYQNAAMNGHVNGANGHANGAALVHAGTNGNGNGRH
jgi:capsular exopolysaccharide synthesis family protein